MAREPEQWRDETCGCRWMPGALVLCSVHGAAPELLAAAKVIASFAVSWEPLTPGDIAELTAAIAKAEPSR